MPIDVSKETLFSIRSPKSFGCHFSYISVLRWMKDGARVRGTDQYVKLERINQGGNVFTTKEAYIRFVNWQNGISKPPKCQVVSAPKNRSLRKRGQK